MTHRRLIESADYRQLPPSSTLAIGDYIEWTDDVFTKVASGSLLIGTSVSSLREVVAMTSDGQLSTRRPARAYRDITVLPTIATNGKNVSNTASL